MEEPKRALGYLCPRCGKAAYGERTAFALQAATAGLACTCGKSKLTAECIDSTFRVTTPCGVCGGEHRGEVPVDAVLQGEGVGLACPKTRQLCCYIGAPRRVQAALRRLEEIANKKKERNTNAFADDIIMYEVLEELRDMAARGGIRCTCGGEGCSLEIHSGGVDVICSRCGSRFRVPAATDEDLDALCSRMTLTIRGT